MQPTHKSARLISGVSAEINMKSILVLVFCLLSTVVFAENLVVPIDLYEYINKQGCNQVSDFFSTRPAVENPPYALNVLSWGKFEFAVWCTKDMAKEHHERKYSLLLNFDDAKNPLAACPKRVDDTKFIGGLSFEDVDEPAKWYVYLDTREPVSKPGNIRTKAIRNIYDGDGKYYICIGGRWAGKYVH